MSAYVNEQLRLTVDRNDLQFSVVLAMALTLLVVLTTTHFENADFVVTTLADNLSEHRSTCDQRSTKLNGFSSAQSEHLIKGDFGANVCRYLFYFKFFTSSNFILFATGFYDRLHVKPHH